MSDKENITEEQAKKDQDKLDNLLNNFFINNNSEKPPEDVMGVDTPLINTGRSEEEEEEEEVVVFIDTETPIEVSEEEVFNILENGDIVSLEEKDHKEQVEKVVYKQSLVDRAVLNHAIRNIYDEIDKFQIRVEKAFKKSTSGAVMPSVLIPSLDKTRMDLVMLKKQLRETNFSQFKDVPLDDIDLTNLENEELVKAIEVESERILSKMIGEI